MFNYSCPPLYLTRQVSLEQILIYNDGLQVVVLAPHGQVSDLLPIGCLIVVSDQAHHCCVVGKLNDGVGVVLGRVVTCEHEVQEGTEHAPLVEPW